MKRKLLLYSVLACLCSFAIRHGEHHGLRDASSYTADVLDKWMVLQTKLMSKTSATFNGPFVRIYSYSGLAAYEALAAGISKRSSNRFSANGLNGLPLLPSIVPRQSYHWPSCVNAALAFMNKAMFPGAAADDKAAIDSLEGALATAYGKEADPATVQRSAAYGRLVAQTIFDWSETDGYKQASAPYTPPTGPGLWVPTPPGYLKPSTPYWGKLRPMVAGTVDRTQPPPPVPYATDTSSAFYKEARQLYEASRHLTPGQKEIVLFWKEINPGLSAPGHWLNILRQVLAKEGVPLDKAAFAYALSGISLNDAWISCWKTRYQYNLLRPVTYIRYVLQFRNWSPLLPTPPHPEYSSGFAAMAGAIAEALSLVFGEQYTLTDHTYDYIGLAPRTFTSFHAMAKEAGDSKMLGGIHFQFSVDRGLEQGRNVTQQVAAALLQARR